MLPAHEISLGVLGGREHARYLVRWISIRIPARWQAAAGLPTLVCGIPVRILPSREHAGALATRQGTVSLPLGHPGHCGRKRAGSQGLEQTRVLANEAADLIHDVRVLLLRQPG
jgi:hypothetical protein